MRPKYYIKTGYANKIYRILNGRCYVRWPSLGGHSWSEISDSRKYSKATKAEWKEWGYIPMTEGELFLHLLNK